MIVGLLKKSSPALMSFREACDEKSKKRSLRPYGRSRWQGGRGLTAVRDDKEERKYPQI